MDATERMGTTKNRSMAQRAALGAAVGVFAGVPQVLAAQLVGKLVGRRSRADIGPRFVHRASWWARKPLSRPAHWSVAGLFHFAYAAAWGAAYAACVEAAGVRRIPPLLGGGALGALIYAVAFSRFGVATLARTERPPDRRGKHEWAVHLVSPFSFSLVLASTYRWWRGRI